MTERMAIMVTLLLLVAPGCSASLATVQQRAPDDLACAPKDIGIEDLGGGRWRAQGCGQRAVYTCVTQKANHDGMVDLAADRTTCTRE
jgi:hypothetical protein